MASLGRADEARISAPTARLFGQLGVTGALIAGILTALEVYILWAPPGSSLRRVPFPVHVAVKTLIYLIVIVCALSFGAWAFPAPGERGIEGSDVPFSLAASFVFVFVMAVNKLLGQNVLLSFVTGRYHRPRPSRNAAAEAGLVSPTPSLEADQCATSGAGRKQPEF